MKSFSLLIAFIVPIAAFLGAKSSSSRVALSMVATESKSAIATYDAPDFYWEFRLERLANKFDGRVPFKASDYPAASNFKDLYGSYYAVLASAKVLGDFDWMEEKKINDAEWLTIYKKIVKWSSETVKSKKPSNSNVPSNDFDLLKEFYPQLNYRDLDTAFTESEVGPNFKFKNMKDLFSAAASATPLSVPGYSAVSSLEAADARKELAALKESTLTKIDAIYKDALAYAQNPFPDEASKTHYQKLRGKLATFPQSPQAWATYRANIEKEVDEMARMASKEEEEHHHHEGEGEHVSMAEEFKAKYGLDLDEMQQRLVAYKQDPEAFLENSIVQKYGKNGLEIWKKSQEFSAQMSVMSDSDKAAVENAFSDFLKKA